MPPRLQNGVGPIEAAIGHFNAPACRRSSAVSDAGVVGHRSSTLMPDSSTETMVSRLNSTETVVRTRSAYCGEVALSEPSSVKSLKQMGEGLTLNPLADGKSGGSTSKMRSSSPSFGLDQPPPSILDPNHPCVLLPYPLSGHYRRIRVYTRMCYCSRCFLTDLRCAESASLSSRCGWSCTELYVVGAGPSDVSL
jgi:hypothetical protein